MILPEEVRDDIRDRLWALADDLGWSGLGDGERAAYYEKWTKDATIGGRLGHFMDPRKVRVYIKDSLLKPYERRRLSLTEEDVWAAFGVTPSPVAKESFIKPHGRRLVDDQIVCWGKSRDWKHVLMAAFERMERPPKAVSASVALLESGKVMSAADRRLVELAASRLGVSQVKWIE